jgi:hypothetical protein
LSGELSDTATTVTLTTTDETGDNGFLLIDNEWIHYRGTERGATTLTLQNLTRGLLTSVAATHAVSTPVYWCVATIRMDLFNQLLDQARAFLHELTLIAAAPQSRDVHERMVSYDQARADAVWHHSAREATAQQLRDSAVAFLQRTESLIWNDDTLGAAGKTEQLALAAQTLAQKLAAADRLDAAKDRLAAARQVLRLLGPFVLRQYPQHAAAVGEILEPFAAYLEREIGT